MSSMSGGGDALFGELSGLLGRLDPVPPQLLAQVRRAFDWRNADADLADLSFDSLLDRDGALAVRSAADIALEPRMLGFGAVIDGLDVSIEVEVSSSGGHSALIGQIWPAIASVVEVQKGDGTRSETSVDEHGRFMVDPVPGGPVRLCIRHGDRTVHTTWVSYASG